MSDPLYRKDLLRLAADANGAGRIEDAHATGVAFNPACGDRVSVDLVLTGDRIEAFAHETKACVLAQASASILGRALKGARQPDVERLHSEIRTMLESRMQAPAPPFGDYAAFQGAVEYTSRHRCVLLPVEAVLEALAVVRQERGR